MFPRLSSPPSIFPYCCHFAFNLPLFFPFIIRLYLFKIVEKLKKNLKLKKLTNQEAKNKELSYSVFGSH